MIKDNLRILLVEDHPFQLRATQYLLESYGFTRLTTTDCAQGALQQMLDAEQPFDILLCDQCLPDISGIELVRFASRRGMIKQAILLSSLTQDELDGLENMANIHDLPLLGYLVKPLKQTEFIQLLTSAPLKNHSKNRV
ncbi:response regulator [Pseudomonas sp. SDO5532_S415]|jgi:CheY-like chemotaxis protein|uniref:response regulator n=1 Tax=Pseudomonas sp. Irchel 3A7 TaxID=2008913 RepID=UPI000BA4B7B9|nr:response regulator [Pseudomonas sp. Irchel 3A7]